MKGFLELDELVVAEGDHLFSPRCGESMKIIAFIEARRRGIIRKILEHCGLWQAPPARGRPRATCRPIRVRG